MSDIDSLTHVVSDEELVQQTRAGEQCAFAELWHRHYRSGVRVARQFASIDADELVSEAFAQIYQRALAGDDPIKVFRPALYRAIRALIEDAADAGPDPVAIILERTLTVRAFGGLPDRWQAVLWYTDVEGLDPHEVAPLLGMTPNGVAALSYRAREGLRAAWLRAHRSDAMADGADGCVWAISRVSERARRGLTAGEAERLAAHCSTCNSCAIVTDEADQVASRLALVMVPLLLGGAAGGSFLGLFGGARTTAWAVDHIPELPDAVVAGPAVPGPHD